VKRLLTGSAVAIMLLAKVRAQDVAPGDEVRVTVSLNADGSRTTYEFDHANKSAVATTADAAGKVSEKIRYKLDDAGRFQTGEILAPNDKVRYRAQYKYDGAGRLSEETHLTVDNQAINKIVFRYDANGKQSGYTVYDASGKVVGETSPLGAAAIKRRGSR
jgi:YD repeat-containing protein